MCKNCLPESAAVAKAIASSKMANSGTDTTINFIYQVNGVLPINNKLEDSLITDLSLDSVEFLDLLMRLVDRRNDTGSSNLTVADTVQRVQEST